jgi:hypothetical protein
MTFNPDGKDMVPEEQNIFDYLLASGAMEIAGIDSDTGEFLYAFTPKIKNIMPEMYEAHLGHVNKELMKLWEMGFVNIDLMKDDPLVTLSSKAFDNNEISKLSKEDQWSIAEVKRMLKVR